MKKKLLLIVLLCVVFAGVAISEILHIAPHTGVYLSAANGEPMVVVNETPIVISSKGRFDKLRDGDKLLVFIGDIAASFPAEAKMYAHFKLGNGNLSDIPESVRNELEQLGWISSPD